MRFMKKFGALALATVAVATSVWYVTPAVQALAEDRAAIESDVEESPTESPTENPTVEPKDEPTESPTENPTVEPKDEPIESPTENPTVEPKDEPIESPTENPTVEPKDEPTVEPTDDPSEEPTVEPTKDPTDEPTKDPTDEPTKGGSGSTETTTSKTVVDDASPASSSSSVAPVSAAVKVVAPNGQTLLQYTAIGAKNTLMAAPEGIVPQGAILAQYEVKEDSQTYEVAKTILGLRVPNATLAKVLDFNLSAKTGTLVHQLNGRVAISFDIPANFTVPAGYVPRVYRFNDDGTVTACETILDKGKVVFGTDHFSTFALVLEKAPKAAKAK